MVMRVFVRLLACLPIRVYLCFFGWLVVACVFLNTLRHIFMSYSHFGRPFFAFLALWGALRLHCNAWGSTLPPLVTYFCMFFVLGGTLGLSLLICGLRLGTFGVHFGVFLWLCGRILGPFFGFLETLRKRVKKKKKKGAEMDVFSIIFQVFPENGKVRFDCAGASGLRFRPLIFWLRASIFAVRFLHRFFDVFGLPWGSPKS